MKRTSRIICVLIAIMSIISIPIDVDASDNKGIDILAGFNGYTGLFGAEYVSSFTSSGRTLQDITGSYLDNIDLPEGVTVYGWSFSADASTGIIPEDYIFMDSAKIYLITSETVGRPTSRKIIDIVCEYNGYRYQNFENDCMATKTVSGCTLQSIVGSIQEGLVLPEGVYARGWSFSSDGSTGILPMDYIFNDSAVVYFITSETTTGIVGNHKSVDIVMEYNGYHYGNFPDEFGVSRTLSGHSLKEIVSSTESGLIIPDGVEVMGWSYFPDGTGGIIPYDYVINDSCTLYLITSENYNPKEIMDTLSMSEILAESGSGVNYEGVEAINDYGLGSLPMNYIAGVLHAIRPIKPGFVEKVYNIDLRASGAGKVRMYIGVEYANQVVVIGHFHDDVWTTQQLKVDEKGYIIPEFMSFSPMTLMVVDSTEYLDKIETTEPFLGETVPVQSVQNLRKAPKTSDNYDFKVINTLTLAGITLLLLGVIYKKKKG